MDETWKAAIGEAIAKALDKPAEPVQLELPGAEDFVTTPEEPPASGASFELDPEQADALYLLCHEPIGVITGGPGRGKTKTLQAALPYLGKSVALCAPSGKAARRMSELTGYPASTVHRLLGLRPDQPLGTYHAGNPLPVDVVVVDEASTLDSALCARLLEACDTDRTRLFFIGDVDQLPSVGPGQVLLDLIESNAVPVVRLTTMHRSAAESWVCRMAPEILEGRIDLSETPDFHHVEADADVVEATVTLVENMVRKFSRDEVQVVVPMNVGNFGATVLNGELQAALNPPYGPSFAGGKHRIGVGDSVVVVSNDYEKGVFNGETGKIFEVADGRPGRVVVDLIDRKVEYTKSEAGEFLRLSYALSVHKMQGSEVGWIVLVMHESHGPLLSRKLLYTAVTRAKQGVIIVGQRSAVLRAVSVEDTTRRVTTLRRRIEQAMEAS